MAVTSGEGSARVRVARLSVKRTRAMRFALAAHGSSTLVVHYRQDDKALVARLPLSGEEEACQLEALLDSVSAGNRQAAANLYARLHERWAQWAAPTDSARDLPEAGVWDALLRCVLV